MSYLREINPTDIDVVNYEQVIEEAYPSIFIFEFEISVEHRSWGIKSISLYAPKLVSGSISDDLDTEIDCKDFIIENNVEINSDQITITQIEVNVKEKIIYIS